MSLLDAPAVNVDPYSYQFLESPYRYHDELRDAGPVVKLEKYDVWAMARFKQVSQVLQDFETYMSGGGMGLSDLRTEPNKVLARRLTLEIDPPDHGKYRKVLSNAVSPHSIRSLRDDFTRAAELLVDRLLDLGEFDAIPDLARAYPLKVFPDAIGMRTDGRENLLPWSDAIFNSWGPDNELLKEAVEASKKAYPWIMSACERDALAPDGLGAKIYEAADRGEIPMEDAPFLVRPFLTAGLDTTIAGIGAAVLALATHSTQWAMLRGDPSLSRRAFEEALRWESPIQLFGRTTSRSVDLEGYRIPENAKVLLFFGAANRDPSKWDRPEEYQIMRDVIGHVAFGNGIHTCVGQLIARLEGEILLSTLARRISSIEVCGRQLQTEQHHARNGVAPRSDSWCLAVLF
jgi:4-methoxybenzoate monooxygenase (O-demethylating)